MYSRKYIQDKREEIADVENNGDKIIYSVDARKSLNEDDLNNALKVTDQSSLIQPRNLNAFVSDKIVSHFSSSDFKLLS